MPNDGFDSITWTQKVDFLRESIVSIFYFLRRWEM